MMGDHNAVSVASAAFRYKLVLAFYNTFRYFPHQTSPQIIREIGWSSCRGLRCFFQCLSFSLWLARILFKLANIS